MKRILYILIFFIPLIGFAQNEEVMTPIFSWTDGPNTYLEEAQYGELNEILGGSTEIGGRNQPIIWEDNDGVIWLFGGLTNFTDNFNILQYGNDLWKYNRFTKTWTWVSGSNLASEPGVYGTKGTPHADNIPGARAGGFGWVGNDDNLYLFGGIGIDEEGNSGRLNDVWRYNKTNGLWTWISGENVVNSSGTAGSTGQSSVNYAPSGRSEFGATLDTEGNLWVFGGISIFGATNYFNNNLWKFNPTTLEWTYVKGSLATSTPSSNFGTKGVENSENIPSGVRGIRLFADSENNLWTFGGSGNSGYPMLWKFNVGTNNWTWISGENSNNSAGNYGELNESGTEYFPGSRMDYSGFIMKDFIYIYGGNGIDGNSVSGRLNDLWVYDISTDEWTWISGSKFIDDNGYEGEIGEIDFDSYPAAKYGSANFFSKQDEKFYSFGGFGRIPTDDPTPGTLRFRVFCIFWSYDPTFDLWIKEYGQELTSKQVIHGEKNFGILKNTPGNRAGAASFSLPNGDLMLFGGNHRTSSGTFARKNDLWKYSLEHQQWMWVGGSNENNIAGEYGTKAVSDEANLPGARQMHKILQDDDGNAILFGGNGFASSSLGYLNDIWYYDITANEWTWIGGSNLHNDTGDYTEKGVISLDYFPSGRQNFTLVKGKEGVYWIFGGFGRDKDNSMGRVNDLWKLEIDYDLMRSKMTWVSGTGTANQYGEYGEKGVSHADNIPGARENAVGWVDQEGNLWLFGGIGFGEVDTVLGNLNDLWKFDIITNEWTWVNGPKVPFSTGIITEFNKENEENYPPPRGNMDFWRVSDEYVWFFGGGNFTQNIFMWRYNVLHNQWAPVLNTDNTNNIFGEKGGFSPSSRMGWRQGAVNWYSGGFLWHYGGNSYDVNGQLGQMSDLWKIDIFSESLAPTDILLSNAQIAENNLENDVIGSILVIDPDANDLFTFQILPASAADTFSIIDSKLVALVPLNYELQDSYSFKIKVADKGGHNLEKEFTMHVLDMPEAPTEILITNNTFDENEPIGIIVGELTTVDEDEGDDQHTFSFVSGSGDIHNSWFTIDGNQLKTNQMFDYEEFESKSFTIRVQATDKDGLTFSRALVLEVQDVNDVPTDIELSNASIAENQPVNTLIGSFTTEDQDADDDHTYEIIPIDGSDDHTFFSINNEELWSAATFNFEEKNSYTVRIRTTDLGELSFEKDFVITILDDPDAPTDIYLVPNSIEENQPIGTLVGVLTAEDEDADEIHTFAFIGGTGSVDNTSFSIADNELYSTVIFDFETKDSYSIRVRVADKDNLTFDKILIIEVEDVNEVPTELLLSNNTIEENLPIGSLVGLFTNNDPDQVDEHIYTLVSGAGSADNDLFQIIDDRLENAFVFDFEDDSRQQVYNIRIRVTDKDGLFTENAFVITILDVNEAPTAVLLNNSEIEENQPINAIVGSLSAIDEDAGDSHVFTLVSGDGSNDNAVFNISGNSLRTSEIFNYEVKNEYTVRIRASDQGGLYVEDSFVIVINDINDAPEDILLSANSIAENEAIRTLIGELTAIDEDVDDTHTFSLPSGSLDNAHFSIEDNQLKSTAIFDFETKNEYQILIRTTDNGGLIFEKVFTIDILDVNEAPTDIFLSNHQLEENLPISYLIGFFTNNDPDLDDEHTYELVNGSGDEDNAFFSISGDQLLATESFDYEDPNHSPFYNIRVRVTDKEGLFTEKNFTIEVLDVNEAPTDILLSSTIVMEGQPAGALVGTLSTIDPDDVSGTGTYTYALVVGEGSADNDFFELSSNELKTSELLRRSEQRFYQIRLRSTDTGGLSFDKEFNIEASLLIDNEPPQISIINVPSNYLMGSNQGAIAFTVTDNYAVSTIDFRYRNLGQTQFDEIGLPVSGSNTYQLSLTDELISDKGIEFFIHASDTANNLNSSTILQVVARFGETNSPELGGLGTGGTLTSYRMFAMPYVLEDNRIETIFEQKLTPYNKLDWRLLHWSNNRYLEYKEGLSNIELGKGYWFNSQQKVEVAVGAGSVPNYSEQNQYSLSLTAGWNQIGNPYIFDISWDAVLATNASATNVSRSNVYRGAASGYEEVDVLKYFEGAFVFSESAVTLNIPYQDATNSAARTATEINLSTAKKLWSTEMQIVNGSHTSNTLQFGMNEDDKTTKSPIPPRFVDYLELASIHRSGIWPFYKTDLTAAKNKQVWEISAVQNKGISNGQLRWSTDPSIQEGQLMLVDEVGAKVVDMSKSTNYHFNWTSDRTFYVFYDVNGVEDWSYAQASVGLVYPNPTSSSALIPLVLPEFEAQYEVEVRILDISGRQSGQVFEGKLSPGHHLIPFERGNRRAGLYLYQLRIKGENPQIFTGKISIK